MTQPAVGTGLIADVGAVLGGSIERAPWGWALLATVVLALIKVWPVLHLQVIEAKAKLRQERRDDLSDCKSRLDEMTKRLDATEHDMRQAEIAAQDRYHELEMKLLGAIAAYRILDTEMETSDPGNTALGQARLVLSTSFTISPSTSGHPEDIIHGPERRH